MTPSEISGDLFGFIFGSWAKQPFNQEVKLITSIGIVCNVMVWYMLDWCALLQIP